MSVRPLYALSAICLAAVVLRLVVMYYFGNGQDGNPVDIYYVDQQAAKQILDLRDPYLYSGYTNHYGGSVIFVYLPLVPIYFTPFVLAGIDIRYGAIAADVITILTIYLIAGSIQRTNQGYPWVPLLASAVYAVMPISIWLTAAVGSNLMVGAMFLSCALAAITVERWSLAGLVLGLGLATDQLLIILFPVFVTYFLSRRDPKTPLISVAVSLVVILPFVVPGPAQFLHDAVLFQFTRPLQQNGTWSLYSLVLSGTGFEMPVSVRVAIFIACTGVVACILRRTEKELLTGLIVLGTVGAFVLPVDGFWSYFLLPIMVACALIPPMLLDFSQHADRGPSGTGGHPAGVANSGVHPQGISVQCTQTRSRASSDTPPVVLW
ncbi:MAG: hypothetical protein JRN09_07050 [Nitrososphaerota archaeon]|nr:hypothetical protein [Nitrososphaerota archaeon]